MIEFIENEVAPPIYKKESDIRMNICNNIRWLFINLCDKGEVCNVKEFAEKCNVPASTAEAWLRRRVIPSPENRKQIEKYCNLTAGSLVSDARAIIEDWYEEYFKRNGKKPSLRLYGEEASTERHVAEEPRKYGRAPKKELLILCRELRQYPQVMMENEVIREIVESWDANGESQKTEQT